MMVDSRSLDENTEKILPQCLLLLTSRGFEMSPKVVRKYAFEFAERQNR